MRTALAAALGLALLGGSASAEDTLKLAVGQRGNWDTSVSEIGQRAGIFKKHGLTLDIVYTDRKSTRLNSSHSQISYAVFCLKKKNTATDAPVPTNCPRA